MVSLKSVAAVLLVTFSFTGAASQVFAEEEVVTVTATRPEEHAATGAACDGLSASESGRLARQAESEGAWQRASDCYVVSGEYARAHRASARVTSDAAAAQKRKASAAALSARNQMARIRAAFR